MRAPRLSTEIDSLRRRLQSELFGDGAGECAAHVFTTGEGAWGVEGRKTAEVDLAGAEMRHELHEFARTTDEQ